MQPVRQAQPEPRAQRAQPGLIPLHVLETAYHAIAAQMQAVMVSVWQPQAKFTAAHSAILVGPGLAATDIPPQMQMLTRHLWRDSPAPMVVDASALDWLALDPVARPGVRVVTPHPGEAARDLQRGILEVGIERTELVGGAERLVGHGPERERDDVRAHAARRDRSRAQRIAVPRHDRRRRGGFE